MSHPAQLEFVRTAKSLFPEMFVDRRVLEIGSLDINGTVRNFFENCDYTGLDIAPGPGVDVVCEGQNYNPPGASFDVVISCEVMEHNPYWAETLENMIRLLKPGGIMVMSCATGGRKEHGTLRAEPGCSPLTIKRGWEYYRNLSARHVRRKVDLSQFASWAFSTNYYDWDLYFLAVKTGCGPEAPERIADFRTSYNRRSRASFYRRACLVALNPLRIVNYAKRKMAERSAAKNYDASMG